eukprot:5436055-Lingulodinium_polyedra.AAC.1
MDRRRLRKMNPSRAGLMRCPSVNRGECPPSGAAPPEGRLGGEGDRPPPGFRLTARPEGPRLG